MQVARGVTADARSDQTRCRGHPRDALRDTPDGYHIAYQTLGEGPIDLLHFGGAYFSIVSLWDEPSASAYLRRQASFRRVILFDKRGQGLCDALPLGEEPSLEWWVDDACAVPDAVDLQQAAVYGSVNCGAAAILLAATVV